MWNARLSRRELIELMLGGNKPLNLEVKRATGGVMDGDPRAFQAFWESEPLTGISPPNMIVVPEGTDADLLGALNASPQAPTPITALTRVLNYGEAQALFSTSPLNRTDEALYLCVALSMVEAVVHSEGRANLRQVTPAFCKRTLSYAWGRALAVCAPEAAMTMLPSRWVEAYALINVATPSQSIRTTVGSLEKVLSTCAQISLGVQPPGVVGELAFSIFLKNREAQERAWQELARVIGVSSPLGSLASATREERGTYLQKALKTAGSGVTDDSVFAACAFLATQVAPGSLEHLEVLRATAHTSIVFWYAMFAALQAPLAIMSGNGGLGIRVLRDMSKIDDQMARPTADIAFTELKLLERLGIDNLSRKFGHIGEIEVELIPLVTSSFSYHSRSLKTRHEPEPQQLSIDIESNPLRENSTKALLGQAVALMAELVRKLPDADVPNRSNAKRSSSAGERRAKVTRNEE